MVGSLGRVTVLDGKEDLLEIPNPLAAIGVPNAPVDKAGIIGGSYYYVNLRVGGLPRRN